MPKEHLLNPQKLSMDKQDEFYIGWQDRMPGSNRRFLKPRLIGLFILVPILAFLTVLQQRGFNNHQFELGNIKEITGVYYEKPVPLLYADAGVLPDSLSRSILLVGFGKFGAEGIMQAIEEEAGALSGQRITLAGTLIYGAGHTVMELTQKEKSLVAQKKEKAQPIPEIAITGQLSGEGEILDPKCYFGVMKPGQGKIHKSCAIRCLSGGIPAVFVQEKEGQSHYYIVLDAQGNKINQALLPYVGSQVQINGRTARFLDWEVLYLDGEHLPLHLTRRSELCSQGATIL